MLNSGFCNFLLELAVFGNCNCHYLGCLRFSADHYTPICVVQQSHGNLPLLFVKLSGNCHEVKTALIVIFP